MRPRSLASKSQHLSTIHLSLPHRLLCCILISDFWPLRPLVSPLLGPASPALLPLVCTLCQPAALHTRWGTDQPAALCHLRADCLVCMCSSEEDVDLKRCHRLSSTLSDTLPYQAHTHPSCLGHWLLHGRTVPCLGQSPNYHGL